MTSRGWGSTSDNDLDKCRIWMVTIGSSRSNSICLMISYRKALKCRTVPAVRH